MRRITNIFKEVARTPRFGFSLNNPQSLSASSYIEPPNKERYSDKISKHRTVIRLYDLELNVFGEEFFVAPNATVVGDVTIGTEVTIWHGAVIRGDMNMIMLDSNIIIG